MTSKKQILSPVVLSAVHWLVALLPSSAAAQAVPTARIERRFDPAKNGPWTVVDLAEPGPGNDPRSLVVEPGGGVLVLVKTPLDGPPSGGAILRVQGAPHPAAPAFSDDPEVLRIDASGRLVVGTKGRLGDRSGRLLALEDGAWSALTDEALPAEISAVTTDGGVTYVGTKSDGVFRLEGRRFVRVGVKTTVLAAGYAWTPLGDDPAEMESIAMVDTTTVVRIGKDFRVRRFDGAAWSDLGNLANVTFDDTGTPASYDRELKSIAVTQAGSIFVGTKGGSSSPEGRDRGALWLWKGGDWVAVTAPVELKKEIKRILPLGGDDLVIGTNESGVFLVEGGQWRAINEGLASEDGKIKGERLFLGADGRLYLGQTNALMSRAPGDVRWTEIGFFPAGEEIQSVAVTGAGDVYTGAKVGAGQGAVYRLLGGAWTQLGPDLPKEPKQVLVLGDGALIVVLGGGAGAFRWTGDTWEPITGSLTGSASDFKELIPLSDARYVAATKQGVLRGEFRAEPLEVLEFALKNDEVRGLIVLGSDLYAFTKSGRMLRKVEDGYGDDGAGWANGARGLPRVELERATLVDGEPIVIGKVLLYRGARGVDGLFDMAPMGSNPGRAVLDGDGRLVFTGETDLKSLVRTKDGRWFLGAKDGLFVSSDDGATWTSWNGPAEVSALALSGDTLYAAVKGELRPDPNDPARTVKTAAIWSQSLVAPLAKKVEPAGCSCLSTGGRAGWSLLALASLVVFRATHRRRSRNPT